MKRQEQLLTKCKETIRANKVVSASILKPSVLPLDSLAGMLYCYIILTYVHTYILTVHIL